MPFPKGEAMHQSSHPVHLGEKSGVSSSFIPFCAYKSNLILSKDPLRLSNISFPLCTSFKPTILEGQLCYSIKLNENADEGKVNELMMLLDYNEDRWLASHFKNEAQSDSSYITTLNLDSAGEIQQEKAKIKIDTLSDYVGFGGGSYRIITAKRMTATPAFLEMSFGDRKCDIERFEDCRTRSLLKACNCVPDQLQGYHSTLKRCDPKGRECIESKFQGKFDCSVSCTGLHAHVHHEENKVNLRSCEGTKERPRKLCETPHMEEKGTSKHLLRMVKEYEGFKKTLFQSFDFNPFESHFGEAIFSDKNCSFFTISKV